MQNHIYEIPVEVKIGRNCNAPSIFVGAIVSCYVSAPNHLIGLEIAVKQLTRDGYYFINIISEIREIHLDKWQEIFNESWKEITEYLPNQDDIMKTFENDGVVYGPFIGYERE